MGGGAHTERVDPFGVVGQVLDGQFRVDRVVGEGGFSVVYKGHHLGLDEPIAVKCLKLPVALGSALVESFVRRFRDESRLHYRLSQGNLYIARSIASGTTMAPVTGALVPYMVLEWLEGKSLAEDFHARRARGLTGRTLAEVVKLLDPAMDAIAYAHAQGVVHRDLNPGNLFLATTRDGTKLKVLDFGVAKVVSDHALEMGPRAQTIGQIRIFSPAYGAPEQFDDQVGKIGAWTDVYALALIILEALSDRTVNEGEHIGEFAMRTLDPDRRPTPRAFGIAVGDEVESLLASATSLVPAERPQDAGELWGRMKHALRKDAESGRAPHASRPPAAPPRPSSIDAEVAVSSPPVAVEVMRPRPSATPIVAAAALRPSGRPGSSTLRMREAPARPPSAPPPEVDMSMSPLAVTPGVLVNHDSFTPPAVAATPAPSHAQVVQTPYAASEASGAFASPRPSLTPAQGSMWIRPSGSGAPPAGGTDLRAPPAGGQGTSVQGAADAVVLPRSRTPLVVAIAAGAFVVLAALAALAFYFVSMRAR